MLKINATTCRMSGTEGSISILACTLNRLVSPWAIKSGPAITTRNFRVRADCPVEDVREAKMSDIAMPSSVQGVGSRFSLSGKRNETRMKYEYTLHKSCVTHNG